MTAPFECEVRFLIADIDAFRRGIAVLGGGVRFEYAFTDHYYRPHGGAWDPTTRALRVREHHRPPQPSEVLLTWVDLVHVDGLAFKRSRFPEGKVRLHLGSVGECRSIADGLGYEPWLVVRKLTCEFYDIPDVGELVVEQVDGIGWMGEVEVPGHDPQAAASAIRRKLDALRVSVDAVLPQPLAALAASRLRPARQKVYFSGSISGGRTLQPVYAQIVSLLQQRGYQVLTTHVADPDIRAQEGRGGAGAADIYDRDVRWLAECDLVIAEVSMPSLGVGVEVATAQQLGKPVLCLCRADVTLSAMIEGNPGVRVVRYRDDAELPALLDAALPTQPAGAAQLSARETHR